MLRGRSWCRLVVAGRQSGKRAASARGRASSPSLPASPRSLWPTADAAFSSHHGLLLRRGTSTHPAAAQSFSTHCKTRVWLEQTERGTKCKGGGILCARNDGAKDENDRQTRAHKPLAAYKGKNITDPPQLPPHTLYPSSSRIPPTSSMFSTQSMILRSPSPPCQPLPLATPPASQLPNR